MAARKLQYQSGFWNEFATEAEAGALPRGQNSPQHHPLGLYTEQFSGTPFTEPRATNRRTWLYRIRPSVTHQPFQEIPPGLIRSGPFDETPPTPNQLRWDPLPIPEKQADFIDGIVTMAGHGPDAETYERASNADLRPQYLDDTLAFMFETQLVMRPTKFAMESRILKHEYFECWQGLKKHFQLEPAKSD